MPARKEFTKQAISALKIMAKNGYTIVDMAKKFEVNRAVIYRLIKENNIKVTPTSKNKRGRKFDWTFERLKILKRLYASDQYNLEDITKVFSTSEKTICNKARELGLVKVRKAFFTEEKLKFLEDNAKIMTTRELANALEMNPWTIVKQLKKMNLYDKNRYKSLSASYRRKKGISYAKELYFEYPEFVLDLENPSYSHSFLARKYELGVSTIKKWREEKYGTWKNMVDTYLCKSSSEIDFENILSELKLSYLYEYKIDNWKIDYYLGFNLLVEIQGSHWHDEIDKVIKKDKAKKEDLINKGYDILYVWDYEINDNPEEVKIRVLKALKKSIDKYYNQLKSKGLLTL